MTDPPAPLEIMFILLDANWMLQADTTVLVTRKDCITRLSPDRIYLVIVSLICHWRFALLKNCAIQFSFNFSCEFNFLFLLPRLKYCINTLFKGSILIILSFLQIPFKFESKNMFICILTQIYITFWRIEN